MRIFILWQRSDGFLAHPHQARGMVIIAPDEKTARALARKNEDEERDDGLSWEPDGASCEILTAPCDASEILTASGDARIVMVA